MVAIFSPYRIEYDAYRADMESLQLGPKDASTQAKLHEARVKYEKQKERFDKLRQDVAVKLKFLEENKVRTFLQIGWKCGVTFGEKTKVTIHCSLSFHNT